MVQRIDRTWSRELTDHAQKHLAAFAAADVDITAMDFVTFLSELCGVDVARLTLTESQRAFFRTIAATGANKLGPWKDHMNALYGEVRAFLLGNAISDKLDSKSSTSPESDSRIRGTIPKLSDEMYINIRGNREGVGLIAARHLVKLFNEMEDNGNVDDIFPELKASSTAIDRLLRNKLPQGFNMIDRIVVDEVQDLTLLEASVIIELCRAIERNRGYGPWLLVAGDDGQTVRPSGFKWGPLNDLIGRKVGIPDKFQLDGNLRCPAKIAMVIDRASCMYRNVQKRRRPTKQQAEAGGQHVDANLFHVAVNDTEEAIRLIGELGDLENVVIVTPDDSIPRWLPPSLRQIILTPADTKGLEYQSVCVLNPGVFLRDLHNNDEFTDSQELDEHSQRTAIDQLRVALSRATETLAFIDVGADEKSFAYSLELLDEGAQFSATDLLDFFSSSEISAEERVLSRINDARALIDERPARAWQRALQAVTILSNPHIPNGVSDPLVRSEAHMTLLATGSRILVDMPSGISRSLVVKAVEESINLTGQPKTGRAFYLLNQWTGDKGSCPLDLLDAACLLENDRNSARNDKDSSINEKESLMLHKEPAQRGDNWLKGALVPLSQELRRKISHSARTSSGAEKFSGNVEGWLKITGFTGNISDEAMNLRREAFDTLLKNRELKHGKRILKKIEPPDLYRTGQLREAQGEFVEAAKIFRDLDKRLDALRNWRLAGQWEEAVKFAENNEKADLQWLNSFEEILKTRPKGHNSRLTEKEKIRLKLALDGLGS